MATSGTKLHLRTAAFRSITTHFFTSLHFYVNTERHHFYHSHSRLVSKGSVTVIFRSLDWPLDSASRNPFLSYTTTVRTSDFAKMSAVVFTSAARFQPPDAKVAGFEQVITVDLKVLSPKGLRMAKERLQSCSALLQK
jgi:hypothetical protein